MAMCHGAVDLKYAMRDIEARVKSVAEARDKSEEAAQAAPVGLLARLGATASRWFRKDAGYV
jgi:hypothetical protein